MTEDTIAAISTPLGEGGIAIIRVSGPQALPVADRIFVTKDGKPSSFPTHTIHFGRITRAGKTLDHAMLAIMRAPRSYTTEDNVEFNCHGGMFVARAVLNLCLEHGARLAEPGEFTKRAFLNGRLDLAQAEAVMDLISAKTDRAQFSATNALEGHFSRQVEAIRSRLMTVLAHIEAQLDFPEDDIAPATRDKLLSEVCEICEHLQKIRSTSQEGKILRQGISVAIIGRPNAGKSSLMNLLLGEERSIVTPAPGTTRDTIDEYINIRGIPIRLTDTAGIRKGRGVVESIGVKRAHKSLQECDIVLHVIDASRSLSATDVEFTKLYKSKRAIVCINKVDLKNRVKNFDNVFGNEIIMVSCATGFGLDSLKDAIEEAAWKGVPHDPSSGFTINDRHADAIRRALDALHRGTDDMYRNEPLDIVAQSFRLGLTAIGEIVGRTSTEDLLSSIFKNFCIGK